MIHIICTDISMAEETTYNQLYERASAARKAKADRYRRREDALRCLTGEALLRYALGTGQFSEAKMPDGKPYILQYPDFHFNLSHSGSWVVLAFGDSEVGVDIESVRPETNIEMIGRRFFSGEEQRYIREDASQSRQRFFEVWTAKESYVKFLGTGLKTDLTSFSVRSLPREIRLRHWKIEDYYLCLCTKEDEASLQKLDVQQLLQCE